MRLQNLSLAFGQGLRLLHQRIWNADLADVVQASGKINRFARVIRLAERLRQQRRKFRNAIAMLAGGVVSHLGGECDLLKQDRPASCQLFAQRSCH